MDIQVFLYEEKTMKKHTKKASIISSHAWSNDLSIDFVNASIIVKGNFRFQ